MLGAELNIFTQLQAVLAASGVWEWGWGMGAHPSLSSHRPAQNPGMVNYLHATASLPPAHPRRP